MVLHRLIPIIYPLNEFPICNCRFRQNIFPIFGWELIGPDCNPGMIFQSPELIPKLNDVYINDANRIPIQVLQHTYPNVRPIPITG